MESGYRHTRRIGSTGLALATAAWLVFPSSAAARELDPVSAGSCTTRPSEEKVEPASENSDERPTDTESGPDDSGLSVSLSSTLHLGGKNTLVDLLSGVCETGKDTVGGLFGPVLGDEETTSPNPGDTPQDEFDENDLNAGTEAPDSLPDPETTIPESTSEAAPAPHPAGSPPGTGAVGGGWGGVSVDRAPGAIDAPPTQQAEGSTFSAAPHDSRASHDVKAVERLPLLLAVLSVVLVAAALAHTWARRTLLR